MLIVRQQQPRCPDFDASSAHRTVFVLEKFGCDGSICAFLLVIIPIQIDVFVPPTTNKNQMKKSRRFTAHFFCSFLDIVA